MPSISGSYGRQVGLLAGKCGWKSKSFKISYRLNYRMVQNFDGDESVLKNFDE